MNNTVVSLTNILYNTTSNSKSSSSQISNHIPNLNINNRWNVVLKSDMKSLWRAINWKGDVAINNENRDSPNDAAFVHHFQNLLFDINADEFIIPEANVDINTFNINIINKYFMLSAITLLSY